MRSRGARTSCSSNGSTRYSSAILKPRIFCLRWTNRRLLPKGYPVDVHFNPPYDPWDQRLCIAPDGDFLKAIRSGRVSMVTGGIERFTPSGVRMNSGKEVAADVIVAATGLVVSLLSGMRLSLDGVPLDLSERIVFKGTMLDGVPNLCFVFGYVNASWTLRADLISRFFCRLLKALEARGEAVCVVQRPDVLLREHHAGLHSFRSMRKLEARRRKASALWLRHSQSLTSRRQRPSQAKVRSTIQRLGSATKPLV